MSRSLGVLTLDLIAKTGGFEQGMDRAGRRVRATANEMEAARKVADRFVASIAAAAAGFATAATAMAVSAAKSMDATAKMAQQIGTTTEALSGMRFAAQQFANISDQQFDMAMRRMTRRIAEAAEGSGSAKKALDAMGLSARELARLSPDKQMLAIADAMQRTERQADRLRHTMAIFDTEGMALVPALQQGAAAFEQNIELARRFGVVVSTEAAQAAEQFTTNMGLLSQAQEGFRNQLAEAVLPMLADLSGRLVEIAQRIGPMGDAIEKALKAAGVAAAATAAIFVSRLIGSITASAMAWTAATAEAARYQMALARMAASASGASASITAMTGAAAGGMAVMGRAAQLALGVLGGPAGLLVTAGLTAAAFLTMGRDARTASVDIDELSESFKTLSAQKLELRMFDLEDEVKRLEDQARESGEILAGVEKNVRDVYESAAQGVNITAEELENARRSLLEQRDAHETNNAELDRARTLLNQVIDHLERLKGAAHGAAGGVEALNQAMHSEAGEKFLAQLQSQIKALQDGGDPIKMATRWLSEHTNATDADKAAIMSAAHALKALQEARAASTRTTSTATKALTEAQRAAQNFRREQENSLKSQYREISALNDQAKALDQQISLYGLAESAKYDLAIADLERERAAIAIMDRESEEIAIIERKIELLNQMKGSQQTLERLDAEKQAWESWSRDVEQIFNRVGQSLTDAIFDGGKSGKELLKDLFKGLVFNIAINPVMNQLQGWVTNQLGGLFGVQNPAQGGGILGTAQNLYSGYNAITGGLNSTLGTAAARMGQMMGSEALTSFGLGLSGTTAATGIASIGAGLGASLGTSIGTSAAAMTTTTFSAALGGGAAAGGAAAGGAAAAAGGAAAGGAAGFGAAVGAALPWIGGALAIGSLLGGGLFDREPTTRRGQRTAVGLYGGEYQTIASDSRQAANTDAVIRQMMEEATSNVDRLFKAIGVDAAIDSLYALTESSIKGDRQGVASGGTLRIDDQLRQFGQEWASDMTIRGFGGWSEAEMIPRLAMDLQVSMLEAFQRVAEADQLPAALAEMIEGIYLRGLDEAQLGDLATRFNAVIEQVGAFQTAVEMLPFAQLRDLTFDVAANIIQFAGGLENLDAGMTSYFQNFYSDAERLEWATDQMGAAFENLGLSMPDVAQGADAAKAAYRDLVESLDMNTESGQEAYAVLMTLSGSFAELVVGLEGLNPAVEEVVETVDYLGLAVEAFTRRAADAERALQLSLSGGQLADRLGGMLGMGPVYAQRREQELWAAIGQGSYEQQLSMSQELSELVLSRIDAEQQANQQRLTTLRQELTTYRSLQSIGASLQNYLTSLESSALAPYTLGEKVGNAEAELTRLVQAARGGDESALRQVQGALQNALTLWRDYGASGMQYQDAYHRLTGMVGDLAGQAVSEAEAQLMQLELQAESLESISGLSETSLAQLRDLYTLTAAATDAAHEQYQTELNAADEQLQQLHLMGMDTARLHDIADLLQQLPASIAAQLQTGSMGYLASNPDVMGAFEQSGASNASAFALGHYYDYGMLEGREFSGSRGEKYLLNNPDVMAAFFEHGANMTAEAFARQHYEQYGKFEGRAFARGGLATPGWALVGEGGPELVNFSQPGRVYTASQTNDILRSVNQGGNGQQVLVNEIRALRGEVAQLRQQNEALARTQVQAVVESSRENAKHITSGVGQAINHRNRDDANQARYKRAGAFT